MKNYTHKKASIPDLDIWVQYTKSWDQQEKCFTPNPSKKIEKAPKKDLKIEKKIPALDLHSMDFTTAHTSLQDFIEHAFHSRRKKIKVITGHSRKTAQKSLDDTPYNEKYLTLKENVPRWLAVPPFTYWVRSFEFSEKGSYIITLRT